MARSKRKSSDTTAKTKQAKRTKSNNLVDESVFGTFVSNNGVILKSGCSPNEISKDQAVFQKDISKSIRRESDVKHVIKEFVSGLCDHIDSPVRFRMALMPTITSMDSDARGGAQDSIMKMLLGVDLLQPGIMNMLLEKLAEFSEDDEPVFDDSGRINMARLIMNQFRWLDKIVNNKVLLQKMLEILSVSCKSVQREIIACMPDVIEDNQHADVARQLRDLTLNDSEFTVPVLDAMSNMNLKQDVLLEVRGSVISTLPSVAVEDIPIIVKFLLQTISDNDAFEVVSELRKHLDFEFNFPPESASTPLESNKRRSSGNAQCDRGCEVLTVDTIKSAVRFQRSIAEAWIKAIECVKSSGEHRVIDIFVLVILHANNHKKPVESLFRNKIRNGHFTEVLLRAAFGAHTEVLKDYFPSILAIAEVLLRSTEIEICNFAGSIYKHAFESFDQFGRQEIVGNLVTHIGSGLTGEIDSSLDILMDLVEKCPAKVSIFAVFIKGVLDYLDSLNVSQIRKIYSMVTALAFRNIADETSIQDDLFIIIRKQLTNCVPKYQRMGIIGAIMAVKNLAFQSRSQQTTMDELQTSALDLSEEVYKQVTNLLKLVKQSAESSPEAIALYLDEVSMVVHHGLLHPRVEEWLTDSSMNDFQEDFVVDFVKKGEDMLPWSAQFAIDEENGDAIAINLMPIITKANELKKQSRFRPGLRIISPAYLSPHFRLLQICENRQSGHLEGIDALLGCPIYLPQPELQDKMGSLSKSERDVICSSLFYAANWYREVINAFATQGDDVMRKKVFQRLNDLLDVQATLEKSLSSNRNFNPPCANFTSGEPAKLPVSTAAASKGRKPGKGKKRPLTERDNSADDVNETRVESQLDTTVDSQMEKPVDNDDNLKAIPSISLYRDFFRELDFEVFGLLNVPVNHENTTNRNYMEADVALEMTPKQLEFLSSDLANKLNHISITSATKRRTFLKTKNDRSFGFSVLDQRGHSCVIKETVKLLPYICDHLNNVQTYFKELVDSNDGLIDGPCSDREEAKIMTNCYQYLLQILSSLLSWNGFVLAENQSLLREAFGVMASKEASDSRRSQLSSIELRRRSFEYLEKCIATVPNIHSAVLLCKLLVIVVENSNEVELSSKIAILCQNILKKEWHSQEGAREKGSKFNELLQIVLKIYFRNSPDVLVSLQDICLEPMQELVENTGKDAFSSTYPTLTRNSYPVYYRAVLHDLVETVKTIQPCKVDDLNEEKENRLLKWNQAARLFSLLINLMKNFDGRSNLISILKYGKQFIDAFLKLAMPMLDHIFKFYKNDVQSLLKNIQQSTRSLQHMCGHSKITKDVTLTNQVPPLKKVLEHFVFRVKSMLAFNQCHEAFWLGNLKNRDIKGEEIMSQMSRNEDDSDDSVPEDDPDSEVEMETESVSKEESTVVDDSEEESYSETF